MVHANHKRGGVFRQSTHPAPLKKENSPVWLVGVPRNPLSGEVFQKRFPFSAFAKRSLLVALAFKYR